MEDNKTYTPKDIIKKIKAGDYHLSFSSLSRFAHSPREFINYQLDKLNETRKVTDAMKIGTALHEVFLEGRLYSYDIIPSDRPNRPTKAQLNAKKKSEAAKKSIEFWSKYDEKKCITKEQYDTVLELVNLCENNNEAYGLREFGEVELEETICYRGFTIIRKIDILGQDYVSDLKKCPNVNGYKFARKVRDELLHVQAAIYLLGRMEYQYKWIAVDGKDCIVHSLGSSALENGIAYLNFYLDRFIDILNGKDSDWLKGREFWEKNSIIDF